MTKPSYYTIQENGKTFILIQDTESIPLIEVAIDCHLLYFLGESGETAIRNVQINA